MRDYSAQDVIAPTERDNMRNKPSASVGGCGAWVDVRDELPAIGQRVILFSNGVVQNEIFTLDAGDVSDYSPPEYFWSRDELEDCPLVEDGQKWMPLPKAP